MIYLAIICVVLFEYIRLKSVEIKKTIYLVHVEFHFLFDKLSILLKMVTVKIALLFFFLEK